MSCPEHKSPPHKLIKFFKDSRDSWEKKAKERRKEIRDLEARVRDLGVSRDLWKGKAMIMANQVETTKEELLEAQHALTEAKADQKSLLNECEELKKKLKRL